MIEFTAERLGDLCRAAPVQAQIEGLESSRKSALKRFWLFLLGGLAVTVAVTLLLASRSGTVALYACVFLLVATVVLALRPLGKAGASLKHPVLEALAAQGGMTYQASDFDPPLFSDCQRVLFGGFLCNAVFSDLFHGVDADGRRFALYEGRLEKGVGKHRQQIFCGQVYAFDRAAGSEGTTVVVPDRGLFNFFKPASGMERIKFDEDPEFEKRFEVYSTAPAEARSLISLNRRRELLELRGKQKLFAYLDPQSAVVAVTGADRFEPGSMFRAVNGTDRVRRMFEEACTAFNLLKRLRSNFG